MIPEGQHRWLNSRSSKFLVARGEFNRTTYSDSRRRPLSCTPPSTSLSTSASVEEDDDIINANSVNLTSKVEEISIAELSNVEESEVKEEVTLKTSDSTLPKTSIFLPDLLQLGQQQNIPDKILSMENNSTAIKVVSDLKVVDGLLSANCRSMSSPDFLLLYQPAYDPERDWPQVDISDEVDSAGGSMLNQNLHFRQNLDDQVRIQYQHLRIQALSIFELYPYLKR